MATPKIIPYQVKLRSTTIERSLVRPIVYTNDLRSAEFQFQVTDMQAGELSGATATTLLYMRDGSFFQNKKEDVELTGTTFSYLLKEDEGNHAGIARIQLVVRFNEGLEDEQNFPSQLYEFEIINGLETKVAQEVMIYDWTTLTRDARAYIDQFVADEVFRDAQFENAQFDRNVAFVGSQESRDLAFGVEQTNRGTAFTDEQNERTTAFNESESGRTTAETGRVTAESNRVTAESGRVTKESQRVTAESSRVTAEGNRVTAESGRVTAENARVTAETNRAAAFTAFDTRLTAEETATTANKISAVKSKTFADVDARLEDVEFDTTMMGTNLVINGDFSSGTTGWSNDGASLSVSNNTLSASGSGASANPGTSQIIGTVTTGSKYYLRAKVRVTNALCTSLLFRLTFGSGTTTSVGTISAPVQSQFYTIGTIFTQTDQGGAFTMILRSTYADAATASGKVMEAQYVEVFNLTAIFGAGNEPTAEQMDDIMAKFTNSWFDGTKNLFRANAALNKLMAVDARTEFEAKNLLINGNMSNGTTGWGIVSGVSSSNVASSNTLTNTASGTHSYGGTEQTNLAAIVGNKYYIRLKARVTNADCSAININRPKGTGVGIVVTNPVQNVWYTLADVVVADQTQLFRIIHQYADTTVATGKSMDLQYAISINLTAAFGAGKEPTLAEMDRLMARFPNSWFDGVKPIQTIETLYQEKANKTQEAWITPTLINGWTEQSGYPVRYMKDEMGFVHLKGRMSGTTLNTAAFILPVGYRHTSDHLHFPLISNNAFGGLHVASNGVVTINVGAITNVSLNGITFRVEG